MGTYVAYCGGKMGIGGYITPRKSNVSNITDGGGSSWNNEGANNETDADAYIFDDSVRLHVYKSPCSATMLCTYNGNDYKIIEVNKNIWKKKLNGKIILTDYNDFHNEDSYGNDGYRLYNTSDSTTVEFSFINTEDGDMPTSTNKYMFDGCTGLVSCNVPCQMRNIDDRTFFGCTSLTSYTENPDFVERLGIFALGNCYSLPTLTIGKYAYISDRTFCNCSGASTITWNNVSSGETKANMTAIPEQAFSGCSKLSKSTFKQGTTNGMVIPKGIETIGNYAFRDTRVTDLTLNDTKYVGNYAFYGLGVKTNVDNLVSVGDWAFFEAKEINTTNGMANLTSVGEYAFNMVNRGRINGSLNFSGLGSDSLGKAAFFQTNINGSVNFPNNNCYLSEDCFRNSDISGSVTVRYGVGVSAFNNSIIRGNVNLWNENGSIRDYAFYNAEIHGDVNCDKIYIDSYSFAKSTIAGNLTIHNVAKIECYAFASAGTLNLTTDLSSTNMICKGAFENTTINHSLYFDNLYDYSYCNCSSYSPIGEYAFNNTTINGDLYVEFDTSWSKIPPYAFNNSTINGDFTCTHYYGHFDIREYGISGCTINGKLSLNNKDFDYNSAVTNCTVDELYVNPSNAVTGASSNNGPYSLAVQNTTIKNKLHYGPNVGNNFGDETNCKFLLFRDADYDAHNNLQPDKGGEEDNPIIIQLDYNGIIVWLKFAFPTNRWIKFIVRSSSIAEEYPNYYLYNGLTRWKWTTS